MNFDIRKVSVLNPANGASSDTWIHYPYRSDISLQLIVEGKVPSKIKVLWRSVELEIFDISPKSGQTSITTRFPYVSFKMASEIKVKRLQVEFYSTVDLEHCLQYARQLGLRVQPAAFRKYGDSQRDLTTSRQQILASQRDSEVWGSQISESQIQGSQAPESQLQESQMLASQPQISPALNRQFDFTFSQSDYRTPKEDSQFDTFQNRRSSKLPSIFDQDSYEPPSTKLSSACTNQLASMCDSEIIEYVTVKLQDERFKAFCCRLDKVMQEKAKNST